MKNLAIAVALSLCISANAAEPTTTATPVDTPAQANFSRDQLVAWCIVPFDAKERTPAARAQMVHDLGLKRVAYDWRQKHVAQFEEEILEYQKRGIEYFAFWSWHDAIEPLIRKHKITPQIWQTCPSPKAATQYKRVEAAAKSLLPMAKKTDRLGLKLGLYNHGGWGGEPANLAAVCEYLAMKHGMKNVGIVYNFHHGHDHIEDFGKSLATMKPWLLCLNLNGMRDSKLVAADQKHKILAIGAGDYEAHLIRQLIDSEYRGPIGIIGHQADKDVEVVLKQNLAGLERILGKVNP